MKLLIFLCSLNLMKISISVCPIANIIFLSRLLSLFQVAALTTAEKVAKGEISALQRELEEYQQRLQSATSTKSSDKQTINNLERRIADERRLRVNLESQLCQERKSRKQEEARAAQVFMGRISDFCFTKDPLNWQSTSSRQQK